MYVLFSLVGGKAATASKRQIAHVRLQVVPGRVSVLGHAVENREIHPRRR